MINSIHKQENNSYLLLDDFQETEQELKQKEIDSYLQPEFIDDLQKETSIITNSVNNELKYLEDKSKRIIKNTDIQRNLFSLLSSSSLESIENVEKERDNLRVIEDEFNLVFKKKQLDIDNMIEYKKDLIRRKDNFIKKLADLETKQIGILDKLEEIKNNINKGVLRTRDDATSYKKTIFNIENENEFVKFNTIKDFTMTGGKNSKKKKLIYNKKETKKQEIKKQEIKKQEIKKQEIKKQETKKQETKKQETKKQETKKQETKKQETKKHETKKQETKKHETKNKYKIIQKGKGMNVEQEVKPQKQDIEIIANTMIDLSKDLEEQKYLIELDKPWNHNESIITKLKRINEKVNTNTHNIGIQHNVLNIYNIELIKQMNKEKEFKKNIIENKKKLIDKLNNQSDDTYIKEQKKVLEELENKLKEQNIEIETYKSLNIKTVINYLIKLYYTIFFNIFRHYTEKYNEITFFMGFIFVKGNILDRILRTQTQNYGDNILIKNILIYSILNGFCYFLITNDYYYTIYSKIKENKNKIIFTLDRLIKKYGFSTYNDVIRGKFPYIFEN